MSVTASGRHPVTPPLWPLLAMVAGVLILSGGLYVFSRPGQAEARLSAMEAELKALQGSARQPGDTEVFPVGTVCGGKLYAGYKDQIAMALGAGGLEITSLEIGSPTATDGRTPLSAYPLFLKASGTYEAAVSGVNGLSRFRPALFVDAVTLRNRTERVELELKGRVFCR